MTPWPRTAPISTTTARRCPWPASADTAAVAINKITTTLEADLTAGTAVSVPTHTVGSAKLQVFLDGVLCQPDDQYTDKTVTTIAFADTIPSGHVITAVAFTNATDPCRRHGGIYRGAREPSSTSRSTRTRRPHIYRLSERSWIKRSMRTRRPRRRRPCHEYSAKRSHSGGCHPSCHPSCSGCQGSSTPCGLILLELREHRPKHTFRGALGSG